jgi:hypothetical protein
MRYLHRCTLYVLPFAPAAARDGLEDMLATLEAHSPSLDQFKQYPRTQLEKWYEALSACEPFLNVGALNSFGVPFTLFEDILGLVDAEGDDG